MLLFGILVFLLLSAFFSGSEIAFISASKLDLEVEKDKSVKRGNIISNFYADPKSFLSTMLVGNNIALVIFTYLMTQLLSPLTQQFVGAGLGLLLCNTLIITVVVLFFGEFIPKTLFRLYSIESLYMLSYPLSFFKSFLAIPTWIATAISGALLKYVFRAPVEKTEAAFTRVDLQNYIEDNISEDNEDIDKDIFTNALHLDQIKVRNCLIPRTEIIHIDVNDPISALLDTIQTTKLSRILVVEDEIENVIGYVHHQQLLHRPKSIKDIVLDIPFIPEAMNVRDLMLQFIKESTNIACVVDEFGGIAGMITLEDMLEEIFGEIEDEHDVDEIQEFQISENEFRFQGRVEIDMINEKYGNLNIPEGDYHTLSGYIVMTSGTIPEQGSEIEIDGMKFILEKVSEKKIEQVKLIIDNDSETALA